MADLPKEFPDLLSQPDDILKAGLKAIDSRLLKMALLPEKEPFVMKLLRGSNPVMRDMFLDDLDAMRDEKKHSDDECKSAQTTVIQMYCKFVENGGA